MNLAPSHPGAGCPKLGLAFLAVEAQEKVSGEEGTLKNLSYSVHGKVAPH